MKISAIPSRSGLSGLDIHAAWSTSGLKTWLDGLGGRLAPSDPVLLLRADGSRAVWNGDAQLPDSAAAKTPRFVAVELPEDLLLRRALDVPSMAATDIEEAVLLDVRSNTPFPPEDLAWGRSLRELPGGQRRAEIVIASRRHISDFIQSRWPDLAGPDRLPEVWATGNPAAPILIRGYGEHKRLHDMASQQRRDWALVLAAVVLAGLAAMTPTLQLRIRAMEAATAFDALVARSAPLVRKRDDFAALNDKLRALDVAAKDRVDPAGVIAYLTQVMPDDTHLYSLDIQKTKIIAAGHTTDASALLQKLSADPRLRDVRSPMPVTRAPGAAKEAFTVEFTLDTRPVAAAAASASQASQAAASALVVPGAQPASVAATPVPRPAAAALSAPVKPGVSPFVVGGTQR
ncbi:MAG: PilN domain-containing protein [Ramlibacter sp.]